MKAVVPKREPAVAEAAAVENMAAVKAAAMEHGPTAVETAAVKRRASTMEAAATAVKSTMPAANVPPPWPPPRTSVGSISIAAAAKPKEPTKERTSPRLGSGIFIMRETSRDRRRKPWPCSGLPSTRSFALRPSIKLALTI
jgi:hypothetical protein